MASYSSSSCMALACVLAALMITGSAARQFVVGGSAGWVPPSSSTTSFNDWAGKNRFLIGDTLVFKYNPSVDSVERVSAEDYNSCSTSNPIASFKDGNTFFQFPSHGPFYFITANSSNCNKGQKLIVVVLSPRNNSHFSHSPSPAPTAAATPSPAPTTAAVPAPAPAPKTVVAPSPAPTTVVAPSPAPTTVATPSPAPTTAAAIPSPAPTTAATPTPAPSIATPVAPSMSPAGAPTNAQPLNTSPGPAPMGNTGGVTPAGSAAAAVVPYFVYCAVTLVTVVLSGALTFAN